MNIMDIAKAIAPSANYDVIGIRPGEKLHEQMIGVEDAPYTYEYPNYFKILPMIHEWYKDPLRIKDGFKVSDNFSYSSDSNLNWMRIDDLRLWVDSRVTSINSNDA
jgi:FlaA1/EpsC-like NDP-sugar epimerase